LLVPLGLRLSADYSNTFSEDPYKLTSRKRSKGSFLYRDLSVPGGYGPFVHFNFGDNLQSIMSTRSRSAERSISLASQFNLFFVELRSPAQRPASVPAVLAGPFDAVDVPDDVIATHVALASKPDSVPIDEIERCLQIVTDLSALRKNDMHEAISAAVHAERDAHFASKLAEQNAALQAKIADLESALTRSPVRPAGPNDGAEAASVGARFRAIWAIIKAITRLQTRSNLHRGARVLHKPQNCQ
jgi:hypothetical protein